MKRYGNLWDSITHLDNIKFAHQQARKGKAFYSEVKMVDADLDRYAREIQASLINRTFTTSPYQIEDRFDGRKLRTIYKLPYYPDRIVQHALLAVVGPLFVKGFIRDTFQSIPGRGTSDAARRVKALVRSEGAPRYALKVDVAKYYPSVNNTKLKATVRRVIKDPSVLWLLDDIIGSIQGLPIGNYTSQHLGNLYLSPFDWWVKQQVKPAGYFRYCDDLLFFGHSKEALRALKPKIDHYLAQLDLRTKPDWQIYDVQKQGVDFVGFVFRPHATRLRPTIAHRFKHTTRRVAAGTEQPGDLSRVMAYRGWAKACNAKKLWRAHTTPVLRQRYPSQIRSAV
jgi:hypothetical protein